MSSSNFNGNGLEGLSPDDLRKYQALMQESNVEIDSEALMVIAELLRLNVSPDDIYTVLKQISPICGLLKRFKLKTPKSNSQEDVK